MRINHNIASLNTYRQLSTNSANTNKSIEKLSSGLRINRAGDDAAGLAISEKMRGQIRGLDQAARNSQDGISLIQTAEGALNETHSILQRMRELAVQSANDTNTDDDRKELQKEVNQLTSEINRIGNTTEFNTKKLLNGDLSVTSSTTPVAAVTKSVVTIGDIAPKDFSYAVGVSSVGTSSPNFKGTGGDNQIDVAATDGTVFDYSTASAGTITIEKSGTDLKVSLVGGTDGDGDTLDFASINADYDATTETYSFNQHGISFELSKTDFDAMASGDKVDINLATRDAASLSNTGAIGLATDYQAGATLANNANVITNFEVDGSKINNDAATIDIGFNAGKLTVEVKDAGGATLNKAEIDAMTGAETFDAYGIKFDFDAVNFDATDVFDLNTIDLTRTTSTVTVTPASSTTTVNDKSLKFQIGANNSQSMSLDVSDMRAEALGIVGTGTGFSGTANVTNGTDNAVTQKALDVSSSAGASNAISVLDSAIKTVSSERSKLGAVQNRLEHTINNLTTSSENLTAAESRIRDVDMAKEMMEQTKNNILAQAAQAMLAQANQQPQGVLQLLR